MVLKNKNETNFVIKKTFYVHHSINHVKVHRRIAVVDFFLLASWGKGGKGYTVHTPP